MLRLLIVALLLLPLSAWAELQISDSRIKHLPPTVPVRAGYMTIHNPEPAKVTIVEVRSEAFASVEMHQTLMQDGMMRMEQIPALTIDANATVRLEPGGKHLMLMQPHKPTEPGMMIPLTLVLDDGRQLALEITVVK